MTHWCRVLLLAAVACGPVQAATESVRFGALGTRVTVTVRADDAQRRRAALDAARVPFERLGAAWYPWRAGSALARLNRALASGEAASAEPALVALLRRARRLSCVSGGRFDPAIGGLVRLWGFDGPPPYPAGAPAAEAIDRWLARDADLGDLELGRRTVASGNPAVQIDLGGIAKGAIIDRALEAVRAAGVAHAMVNAGGDLAVIGRAQGRRWRAGIRRPSGGLLATVALAPGEALFTSGDYARFREAPDGGRLGHVLDPRTGRPARGAVQASVIARSGTLADAAATALLVADADAWPRVAGAMDVAHVLRVVEPGRVQADPAMLRRVRWIEAPDSPTARALQSPAASTACD